MAAPEPQPLKALSLTRPWPWTILHLPTYPKRIENRTHKQFQKYRGWLLLHAAQSWDGSVESFVYERGLCRDPVQVAGLGIRKAHPTGIVGRCRVVGHIDGESEDVWCNRPGEPQTIDDVDRALAIVQALDFRWWMGGHAIVLADVEALAEPIACKGKLGLWPVPEEVVAKLPPHWPEQMRAA